MVVHWHGLKTIEGFVRFIGEITGDESTGCGWFIKGDFYDLSMEQLWLAFVMSERYQKIWVKEEWESKVPVRS